MPVQLQGSLTIPKTYLCTFCHVLQVKQAARKRIGTRLRTAAFKFKKTRQNSKKARSLFANVQYTCTLAVDDLESPSEKANRLQQELGTAQHDLQKERQRNAELETMLAETSEECFRYVAEKEEIEKLYNEIKQAAARETQNDDGHTAEKQTEDALLTALAQDCVELRQSLSAGETGDNKHTGKPHHQVGVRQQQRNIKKLKNAAEAALWFVETFGLSLKGLALADGDKKQVNIQFQENTTGKSYDKMTDKEKEDVEKTLYILDRFCGSDELYHELVQIDRQNGRPRLVAVKQCREKLNRKLLEEIFPAPGEHPGACRSFRAAIAGEILQRKGENLLIKVAVDGARMSRKSNFVIMTYSVLNEKEQVLSSKGNHTLAVVNGPEDFETLKSSLGNLFEEINEVIRDGGITVEGQHHPANIVVGGDMKFLLMVMGLSGATANHACVWCKVHKQYRHDVSKGATYFSTPPVARTIDELITSNPTQVGDVHVSAGSSAKNKYGQKTHHCSQFH